MSKQALMKKKLDISHGIRPIAGHEKCPHRIDYLHIHLKYRWTSGWQNFIADKNSKSVLL